MACFGEFHSSCFVQVPHVSTMDHGICGRPSSGRRFMNLVAPARTPSRRNALGRPWLSSTLSEMERQLGAATPYVAAA